MYRVFDSGRVAAFLAWVGAGVLALRGVGRVWEATDGLTSLAAAVSANTRAEALAVDAVRRQLAWSELIGWWMVWSSVGAAVLGALLWWRIGPRLAWALPLALAALAVSWIDLDQAPIALPMWLGAALVTRVRDRGTTGPAG